MENEEHRTSDIYEASFLNCAGVPMRTERRGSRTFFIFAAPPGVIAKLRHGFFDGTAQVSAFAYAERVRGLKQLACAPE